MKYEVSPAHKQPSSSFPITFRYPSYSVDHQKELAKAERAQKAQPSLPGSWTIAWRRWVQFVIAAGASGAARAAAAGLGEMLRPGSGAPWEIHFCGINAESGGLIEISAGV